MAVGFFVAIAAAGHRTFGGSAGGHRGVLSCEQSLRTKDFWRLRIGIGRPASRDDVPDFVLEPFSPREYAAAAYRAHSSEGAIA